jgi:cell division protein FtsB
MNDTVLIALGGTLITNVATVATVLFRLRASRTTMEANAADTIQKAAAALVEEQRGRIQTLHDRVDALEKERESLLTQIQALTVIITSMKEDHARERSEMEQKITAMQKRIDELVAERNVLLKQIEALKNGRSDSADAGNGGTVQPDSGKPGNDQGSGAENLQAKG